uniref:non-specific serine/threonine protein kinase n=1 Tax=Oryza glumipatula TaxID=40148 RepID=A0A0E0BJ00_9ORYZ
MKHLYFPLHLLICFALPSLCTSEDRFLYSGFSGANLIVDGAARVRPNGLLEVTNGTVNLYGYAFHPAPLHFRTSAGPPMARSVYRETSVDGMAFLIAPSKNLSGVLANQFLGLLNSNNDGNSSNHIFAVELDTFQNTELKDINDNHVGIDINSVHSMKSQPAGFYDDTNIFRNLSLNSGEAIQIWVDYKEETTQISVTMAPLKMAKPVKPLVCATSNLSEVFVDPAYIGFSSSTGPISTQYIVLGWSFCMGCPAPVINVNKLPKLPHSGRKFPSRVLEIILPIATAALILSVGISITLFVRRRLRLYDHGSDPQTTHVVGTMGYLAPELVRMGKASPLTDVYAFGSFLLEVVCGQKPIKEDAQGNRFMLVNWVLQH